MSMMSMKKFLNNAGVFVLLVSCFMLTSLAHALLPPPKAKPTEIVSLAQGDVQGIRTNEAESHSSVSHTVERFLGIPYAQPPVGDLRWKPAQRVTKHEGIFDASRFGAACPQKVDSGKRKTKVSEDCLTLNIWRPNKIDKPLPVMVWIHGGAFNRGSSQIPGELFANKNIIVVSFNYRLGLLGFFAHPALASDIANFGLTDAEKALKWVQENIAAFGGDPDNVTIFGSSAGGMMVNLLLVSKTAEGLFHKAISQSGYIGWPLPVTAGNKSKAAKDIDGSDIQLAEAYGAATLNPLVDADNEELVEEDLRALDVSVITSAVKGFTLPIVDGITIDDQPYRLISNRSLDIALITGGGSFEGSIMALSGVTIESYQRSWQTEEFKGKLESLYADDFSKTPDLAYQRAFGDERYLFSSYYLGKRWAEKSAPAWLYYLDDKPAGAPGTPHGMDQFFIFSSAMQQGSITNKLGDLMRSYWANFAHFGNPHSGTLPQWPSHTSGRDVWLKLDSEPSAVTVKPEIMSILEQKLRAREK